MHKQTTYEGVCTRHAAGYWRFGSLTQRERDEAARRPGKRIPTTDIAHPRTRWQRPPNRHPTALRRACGRGASRSTAVPVDTVVLDRNPLIRPGEVESPQLAVAIDDLELQRRDRQAGIEHRQPCLALHRRFRESVRKRNQVANSDYAAAASLFDDRAP